MQVQEALFNEVLDNDESVHKSMSEMIERYRDYTEETYAAGMLALLHNAGVDISKEQFRLFLAHRLKQQQMDLEKSKNEALKTV